MTKTDFRIIKRFGGEFIKKRFGTILLAIFFMVTYALANAAQPMLIKHIFDKMFTGEEYPYKDFVPLAIVFLFCIIGISNYLSTNIMGTVGYAVVSDMLKNLYRHFIGFDMKMHYKTNSGELTSRMINDVGQVRMAIQSVVVGLFKQALTFVGLVAVMFYQNWELSLVATAVLFLTIFPIKKVARRLRKLARVGQEQTAEWHSKLNESFKGIRQIKAFQSEEFEIKRMGIFLQKNVDNKLKSLRVSTALTPITSILSGIAVALVLAYASVKIAENKMTPGDVAAFLAALFMAARPLKAMGGMSNIIQIAIVSAERYYDMIDTKPQIVNCKESKPLELTSGLIEFKNVNFLYDDAPALKNLDLVIPAGKKVALVGHSGSGKSTILNLILRFFDPQEGLVEIDGQDIKHVTIESLREKISLVTQDVFLFDDTIAANIGYGRPGASEEEIKQAAITAYAHDFIMSLPHGYKTLVGEAGIRLSGGEKQRISIARSVLRQAPILLLDEATSALDNRSEREFQHALDLLTQGKTTVVIAHRLSTIINSDLIYIMDEGRVIDSGTHNELLERSQVYKELYS